MAIAITRVIQKTEGVFQSVETLSQSTGTGLQEADTKVDAVHLGVGTATGFAINRYLLGTATAREGQETVCLTTGTGEAYLVFTGTATGALVFGADGDLVLMRYMNGTWFLMHNNGATFATATGTA
jgi:hypothetical protein